MKFLSQTYKETQADWFAKRGISWHISVVARRIAEKLQHQAFVHIRELQSRQQRGGQHHTTHPERTQERASEDYNTACLRQDNAGCYHSFAMLAAYRGSDWYQD